ncbi:MAG: aminotransferase class III-fold pyridoxal phosphate-dependent enzyme, partial [Bacteroidetes bacterium]|nr:aminotransferase class III-fold pyridoxal phosphate-dependent enzyme [Bacteroidota bacterium]
AIIGGGYLEYRPFYNTPAYHRKGNNGDEWRTCHLGTDYWLPAHTPIHAVLNGVVHSLHDNGQHRDYGPTLILKHQIGKDLSFYTLFGHLSTASIELFKKGDRVKAGDLIGYIGDVHENGNWVPHLHIQLLLDLLENEVNFPGVAFPSEEEIWKSICPDVGSLFNECFQKKNDTSPTELIAYRQQHLGKSLSLSYDQPLNIVRGQGAYLIDEKARKFLDTVNNVAHVGHEHPSIVKAGQEQMGILNTNTRYLHPAINEFADELLSALPDELSVVHFVNSGSEANELALRMASTYTGQKDFIALEIGYHGNTNAVIDVSSYKFDSKGGKGKPPHTHIVPLPDQYRGIHADEPNKYAAYVSQEIEKVKSEGRNIAGFICESIVSCGGQIVLPDDYLKTAYES